MQIRSERQEDATLISQLTIEAFENAPHSGGDESRIIEALRKANALALSLVAVGDGDKIVGHIAFSPVQIDRRSDKWYGLGPVSVMPKLQRRGIGGALILEGLDQLRRMGANGCVLMGDPGYYGRFGFVSDPKLTYLRYPSPYFQRVVLIGDPPRGDVTYHSGFDVP